MKKRNLLLGMVLATVVSLTACGGSSKEGEEVQKDTSVQEEQQSQKKNDKEVKKGGIAPAAEEDIVVYLGDVEVKMDQTWEEFQQLMETNGWTINGKSDRGDFPMGNDYMGSGYIDTNVGTVEFSFMDDMERNGSVMRGILINPNEVDCDKIKVCGVTPKTDPKKVKDALEVVNETEYYFACKLDNYVTLTFYDPDLDIDHGISVERLQYQLRSWEDAFNLKQYMLETYPEFVYGEDITLATSDAVGEVVTVNNHLDFVIGEEWNLVMNERGVMQYEYKGNGDDTPFFQLIFNSSSAYSTKTNLEYIKQLQKSVSLYMEMKEYTVSDIDINGYPGYCLKWATESEHTSECVSIMVNIDGYIYVFGCSYFMEQWENSAELEVCLEAALSTIGTMKVK